MNENCNNTTKPGTFRELIRSKRFWKPASAVIVGGVLGYSYYYFEGCASGTCAITSSPIMSVIFGGVLGLFVMSRPCRSC
ncbi:MAG: DUF6132 family protein [Bacteroidota bacterium]